MANEVPSDVRGSSRIYTAVKLLGAVLVCVMGVDLLVKLCSLNGWSLRPALWDQAVHALDAIHFAKAFNELSLEQFFLQIHNSALWPPVIPLLQAVYLSVTDFGIGSVRTTIAFSSILAMLAVYFAGIRLHKTWGMAVGFIAAALLLSSPGFQEYSLQVMLEVPGIALSVLTFALYCRYLDSEDPKAWTHTVVSATILFFAKFNYAIMVFLPILVCEFLIRPKVRETTFSVLIYFKENIRWRHPFSIFVYLYIGMLFYIHSIGGFRFVYGEHIIELRRIWGNPVYFLVFTIVLRMVLFQRANLKLYFKTLWNAPDQWKPLVRYFILPACVWLVYPPFFSTFFIFLFSESTRKESFLSAETLTFYPSFFVNYYHAHPFLAYGSISGLLLTAFSWKKLPVKLKLLLSLSAFNVMLLFSHPNYQERYLLTTLPFIFLLSGYGLTLPLAYITRRMKWSSALGAMAGATAFLAVTLSFPASQERMQERFDYFTLAPDFTPFAEKICEHTNLSESNAIVGLSTFLNPAAIAMKCYEMYPEIKRRQLPTTMTRNGFHGYIDGARVVESGKIGQFLVADYSQMKFDVGRKQEAYLLPGARAALPESLQYQYIERIVHPESGLVVTVYRRSDLGNISLK